MVTTDCPQLVSRFFARVGVSSRSRVSRRCNASPPVLARRARYRMLDAVALVVNRPSHTAVVDGGYSYAPHFGKDLS